jgi:GT2 family glycosyltransferase
MDEAYFIYFDDTDFVARAVNAGYLVKYVPGSKLWHKESSSSGGKPLGPLPTYYQTRNRLYFMAKHQKNRLLLGVFWTYFLLARFVRGLQWRRSDDRASRFAVRAAIADYRAGRMGFAPADRYNLPRNQA